jgi:hypothetical protein
LRGLLEAAKAYHCEDLLILNEDLEAQERVGGHTVRIRRLAPWLAEINPGDRPLGPPAGRRQRVVS